MSKSNKVLLSLAVFLTVFFIYRKSYADEGWNQRMRQLASVIVNVLPLTTSSRDFNDPKNKDTLKTATDELVRLTSEIVKETEKPGTKNNPHLKDPLFAVLAKGFAEDSEAIQQILKTNDTSYAQHLLRTSTTYCMTCHARTDSENSFRFPVFPKALVKLSLIDQMKLYAATRHFDTAIQVFEAYLITSEAENLTPFELERLSKLAIVIAIRAENSPERALSITKQLKNAKNVTPSFKREILAWESGIEKLKSPVKPGNDLATAKSLIETASLAKQNSDSKESEIAYLRASSILHHLLSSNTKSSEMAEALYLLGTAYDNLEPLGFWSTSEIYFEACIRKAPHSALANKCFERFQDVIVLGYTGSSGTNIPKNVRSRIEMLKSLAEQKSK